MKRRTLIAFAGTALLPWPLVARAATEIARLGFLGFGNPAAAAPRVEALRAGLRDLGYVEGKNLVIEFRWSSTVEQMHEAAAELAGAPHITVRLLGDNLHFLAMNISGSVYLTTVFADRESRAGAKFKVVHTRHEFTQMRLTGWTSRPEQYYGQCEVVK